MFKSNIVLSRASIRCGYARWFQSHRVWKSALLSLWLSICFLFPEKIIAQRANQELLQTDFPYLTACIGAKGPGTNIAYKGVAIRLDHQAYVCFDTDLLRFAAGWTGDYITTTGVVFDGSHGRHPNIAGEQKFGTRQIPGCADATDAFTDSRPEPFGPIPASLGRWDGLYVAGDKVVLAYTVLGTKIYEQPSSMIKDGLIGFVRTIRIEEATQPLTLAVCDVENGQGRIENGRGILAGASNLVTVVGLAGAPAGVKLDVHGSDRLVIKVDQGVKSATFNIVIWNGDSNDISKFPALLESKPEIAAFESGGPAHWLQEVITRGVLGKGEGAYVVDSLSPPIENPWKRRVRLSGLDFFKDGKRAAVCTWDGDVWIVSGIDDKLGKLAWRRFASGGYETLGLKIVDDVIYTSGRNQITRYHDLNGDGEADYYENFNNQVESSSGFHEFVFDLQTDPEGNFYFAKAGPVRAGGQGFGGGEGNGFITAHAGSVLKVSKDGKKLEVYATGFRAPNGIGVSPSGQVTTGDNEGTWVPACPINWLRKDGFYGVEDTAHHTPVPEYNKPLCWLSHNDFDNSGGGQAWVTSERWGPFNGELLHMSYGQCALYLVLPQKVGDIMQGGVVRIPVNFNSSAMRGKFNPADGQLYIVGLQGWQTKATKIAGFDRVRYTGKPVNSVSKMSVDRKGIHLTFTTALDVKEATDVQNYSAKRWNYHRIGEYGSPEFSVADPIKQGRDSVEITKATLSEDGKTVTLEVSDLKPVMQMQIEYHIKTKDGAAIDQKVQHTIHEIPETAGDLARH